MTPDFIGVPASPSVISFIKHFIKFFRYIAAYKGTVIPVCSVENSLKWHPVAQIMFMPVLSDFFRKTMSRALSLGVVLTISLPLIDFARSILLMISVRQTVPDGLKV